MNTWPDGTPKSTNNAFAGLLRSAQVELKDEPSPKQIKDKATRVNGDSSLGTFVQPKREPKPEPVPRPKADPAEVRKLKEQITKLNARIRELTEQRDKWRERASFLRKQL